MPEYTQANRALRVETAMGDDTFLLMGFSGVEAVSQPFGFELELVSTQTDLDPAPFLRAPVAVTVDLGNGEQRFIHGIGSRLTLLGLRDDLAYYRAQIVPWLWFLGLTRDSRIFQNLSAPEIIEQVFKDAGYSDFELRLTRAYPPRLYCVQYHETPLDFVSRLMEEEGIFYFFEHTKEKHQLVLVDDNRSCHPMPGGEALRFASDEDHSEDIVTRLERIYSVHPERVTLWDYDYLQPNVKLQTSLSSVLEEQYEFPGRFTEEERGSQLATVVLEGANAEEQIARGSSNCPRVAPGNSFKLTNHFQKFANGHWLVLEAHHAASGGSVRAWDDGATLDYRVEFRALPRGVPYRTPRHTPRPVMWSSQTALVVGPKGEEVHVDKYGRIKVQFYWDRQGKRDENSSCWVRVATPWGGKGYGSVSIPRIGNEVVVAFEEGDPDRPLVIGSVYNADQMPPFELPGSGIQMGLKSRSSPGGGGMNEISMTDTKGKEMMNIHAQYDMVTTVEHNDTQTIKVDRAISVGGTHTETVKKDTSIMVSEGNYTFAVSKGTATFQVKGAVAETFDATQTTMVKGDIAIASSTGKIDIEAANEIKLHTGASTITLRKNGDISIHGKKISIIGDDEITESGKKVSVSGGDEAKLGVGNQLVTCDKQKVSVAGAAINSSAVGMHEIAGAVVKIN